MNAQNLTNNSPAFIQVIKKKSPQQVDMHYGPSAVPHIPSIL